MAILEVDAKMLEQISKGKNTQKSKPTKAVAKPKTSNKRKQPEMVTPPESGEDSTPESAPPQKKIKGPKAKESPTKKPLTEKQQAALEKRRAAAAAMTDEEKAERKRLMLEKRKATQAAKAAKAAEELVEEAEPAPKKVKVKEEKPPKWLKDYVSTAKELEEDPETVEERAAESWKTQKKKLVNKYMRNNASLYSMIFRR